MRLAIDEIGAANLYIMSRGRRGDSETEDRDALAELLRQFWYEGTRIGLEQSKQVFVNSSDSHGACKMLSEGSDCKCFLCLIDEALELLRNVSEEFSGKEEL